MPRKNRVNGLIDMVECDDGSITSNKHAMSEKEQSISRSGKQDTDADGIEDVFQKWRKLSKPMNVISRWKDYACSRRKLAINKKVEQKSLYRIGPAPKDERKRKATLEFLNNTHQGIDCDFTNADDDDDDDYDEIGHSVSTDIISDRSEKKSAKYATKSTNNRALIIYFSKLASVSKVENIDLDFVDELIKSGADVNVADKHGQTVFHEVARTWHYDVAKFLLENDADIDKPDKFGRTPLHVAAAVNYAEMVEFLVNNGANLHARTFGEFQTPTHYAAKNDATQSLKMLLKLGGNVHDRDYKNRTALQVAAELDRSETAKYLVENGVPVGVCSHSGLPALTLMIQKMPMVAKEALGQFHTTDRANRKQFFYLNYLETKMPGEDKSFAKLPMECAVEFQHFDLIMHPVFRKLIDVKWSKFAKKRCLLQVAQQFLFVILWTIVGVTLPRDYKYYKPISDRWWNITLESIVLIWTAYYVTVELWEYKTSSNTHRKWKEWRKKELEKDLNFCHPRWPEERKYILQEIDEVNKSAISYFKDAWNYFDWMTYACIFVVVVSRVLAVTWTSSKAAELHPKFMAVALIFIWLRLMKVLRLFQSLGPFIVMIGHIADDTLKFLFLYLMLFIPYVCAFWIIFGGSANAAIMKKASQPVESWEKLSDLIYTVSQITVVGDFAFDSITAVDRLTAQLLVGTFIALSGIVMINIFIALLSDTFQRVYDNAKANAVMQQANAIIDAESLLGRRSRDAFRRFIQTKCSPLENYYDDDDSEDSGELEKMTIQIKEVVDDIDETVKFGFREGGMRKCMETEIEELKTYTSNNSRKQEKVMKQMERKIDELTQLVNELLNRTAPEANRLANLPPPASLSASFNSPLSALSMFPLQEKPKRKSKRREMKGKKKSPYEDGSEQT